MQQHPDWIPEQEHLDETLGRVEQEYADTLALCDSQGALVDRLRIAAGGSYDNDLQVAERYLLIAQRARRSLERARLKPYFTRVDFTPEAGRSQQYYIGKAGLLDHDNRTPVIIDWRSPVASLYYANQVGPAAYRTPGGPVTGELTRKRIFLIDGGKLTSIIEADIVSQDAYLNAILSDHADARLRDIVSTIQAEQDVILRHDPRRPMIVQGVAGAGKTTVALHRITWILYTLQGSMTPANMMVLAPNPLFLNYISAVLPELGVEDVLQTTFHGLAERLCGRSLPPVQDHRTLTLLLTDTAADDEKKRARDVARFKGSLALRGCLENYCAALCRCLVPEGDMMLGRAVVLSRAQITDMLESQLAPFPISGRVRELPKLLKEQVGLARARLLESLEAEVTRKANLIRVAFADRPRERQARMVRLYTARDQRTETINTQAKGLVAAYMKGFHALDLMTCYREFLSEEPCFDLPEGTDPALWREVCRWSLAGLDARMLEGGDLPALILLQKALHGHAQRLDIHHTVIDEGQDYTPMMLNVLMEICHNASFTIVGDLNQGIHGYRGVVDWRETGRVFGPRGWDYFELVTSYRNTTEIMTLAGRVAARHPFPGQQPAQPVLRHGEQPRILPRSKGEDDLAREVRRLRDAGSKTVAIIDKSAEQARRTHHGLAARLTEPVRLLKEEDTHYEGGVMVLPSYLAKGLEFDAVIMADAGRDAWPDDALHARLLYVCLTRPLHYLTVFYCGELTRLLQEHS